ncbi:hypothetical protein EYF80_052123 [Liparis tanakae]|uniref:Uncharacterized protein n=1 Tax=Liparis tanakae TaxID=230148 RepID=A0A4Z2FBE7_9TELE|nr:hypothetical protein EYF80_052123 [Liparis tanakae]
MQGRDWVVPPRPTHSDRGQQPLGHIGDDDADEEDDGLQPGVAQDDRQHEEGHAQEDGHSRDDLDEVLDLLGNGSLGSEKKKKKVFRLFEEDD